MKNWGITLRQKTKIPLTRTLSHHLTCILQINGVEGIFLVDTGASNSCLDQIKTQKFITQPDGDILEMSGAGKEKLHATSSEKCTLGVQGITISCLSFMLIDMEAVNNSLAKLNVAPVDGILGGDVLHQKKAIIDYRDLFLYIDNT